MSSNSKTIADEDGDFSDWIELYNPTQQPIDLEGWGLSDNNLSPFKWTFPEVTMEPGEYLLVWASGKNKIDKQKELHTNFSISADGESLLLTDNFGNPVHFISEVKLPGDISYGLIEGESGFWFFDQPTPGGENSTSGYNEILGSVVEFSHEGGFYTQDFELELSSSDPDVQLYYTLDGSEPSPSNLDGKEYSYKNSYPSGTMLTREIRTFLYNGPITIVDRSPHPYELGTINTRYHSDSWLPNDNYFKGTVVRAKAIKSGALSPYSSTQTYFVDPKGASRYDLPVISIATDESGLFDYHQGIYVAGKVADDWIDNNPKEKWYSGSPANYNQRGVKWERSAHFEYFGVDGTLLYYRTFGLRVHGGWSRSFYRKSLRMYARNSYGGDNRFNYMFFDGHRTKSNSDIRVKSFRRLMLRNSGQDYEKTLYRDALMHDLVKHLPFTTMASQPVVHFVNGEYWGIMNLRERYDKFFLESHFGVRPDNVVVLSPMGGLEVGRSEDRVYFFDIINFAEQYEIIVESNYEWIKDRVDVQSLVQYYAAQIYFYNLDWPTNNMTFWRNRVDVYANNTFDDFDGRWRWMLYDTDAGMSKDAPQFREDGVGRLMNGDINDLSTRLFRRLLLNTEFRNRFINIVSDQLNSCFQPDFVSNKVDEFNAKIASSRQEHYNRWRSGTDEGEVIKLFGNERPAYVRAHTRLQFGLADDVQLVVSKQGGGNVKVNSLLIDSDLPGLPDPSTPYPWEGTYFKEIPVQLKAVDVEGYRFSHWVGVSDLIKEDREIEVALTQNSSITAVFVQEETQLIHYWHFNDLTKGDISQVETDQTLLNIPGKIYYPGTGAGYMDRVNEGTEINARNDAEDGTALRVRNPSDTRHLELDVPTTGFESIKVSYAVTRTGKGSEKQSVFYRTSENGSWTSFRENIGITENYQQIDLDFSHLSEVNNNEHFSLKIDFTGDASSGLTGNNRFDNIAVQGYSNNTGIYEPEVGVLVNVYPNPATDVVKIVSTYLLKSIELSDMNGRSIKLEYTDNYTHTMNVADLPQGLYLITVTSDFNTEHIKLMVR